MTMITVAMITAMILHTLISFQLYLKVARHSVAGRLASETRATMIPSRPPS